MGKNERKQQLDKVREDEKLRKMSVGRKKNQKIKRDKLEIVGVGKNMRDKVRN